MSSGRAAVAYLLSNAKFAGNHTDLLRKRCSIPFIINRTIRLKKSNHAYKYVGVDKRFKLSLKLEAVAIVANSFNGVGLAVDSASKACQIKSFRV